MTVTSDTAGGERAVLQTLLGLTVVTGVVDAASFLGLGHIFTANMTGNVVFLGFALGGGQGVSAPRSLAALVAFTGGSLCGGRIANRHDRASARDLLIAMALEGLLLVTAFGAAVQTAGELSSHQAYAIIVATAAAMGLRNAVVRKLAVPDLTTTVLTLTLTGLAADSTLAGGTGIRIHRRALSVLAMGSGAFMGAILLDPFGVRGPLAAAALLVLGLTGGLSRASRLPATVAVV